MSVGLGVGGEVTVTARMWKPQFGLLPGTDTKWGGASPHQSPNAPQCRSHQGPTGRGDAWLAEACPACMELRDNSLVTGMDGLFAEMRER